MHALCVHDSHFLQFSQLSPVVLVHLGHAGCFEGRRPRVPGINNYETL